MSSPHRSPQPRSHVRTTNAFDSITSIPDLNPDLESDLNSDLLRRNGTISPPPNYYAASSASASYGMARDNNSALDRAGGMSFASLGPPSALRGGTHQSWGQQRGTTRVRKGGTGNRGGVNVTGGVVERPRSRSRPTTSGTRSQGTKVGYDGTATMRGSTTTATAPRPRAHEPPPARTRKKKKQDDVKIDLEIGSTDEFPKDKKELQNEEDNKNPSIQISEPDFFERLGNQDGESEPESDIGSASAFDQDDYRSEDNEREEDEEEDEDANDPDLALASALSSPPPTLPLHAHRSHPSLHHPTSASLLGGNPSISTTTTGNNNNNQDWEDQPGSIDLLLVRTSSILRLSRDILQSTLEVRSQLDRMDGGRAFNFDAMGGLEELSDVAESESEVGGERVEVLGREEKVVGPGVGKNGDDDDEGGGEERAGSKDEKGEKDKKDQQRGDLTVTSTSTNNRGSGGSGSEFLPQTSIPTSNSTSTLHGPATPPSRASTTTGTTNPSSKNPSISRPTLTPSTSSKTQTLTLSPSLSTRQSQIQQQLKQAESISNLIDQIEDGVRSLCGDKKQSKGRRESSAASYFPPALKRVMGGEDVGRVISEESGGDGDRKIEGEDSSAYNHQAKTIRAKTIYVNASAEGFNHATGGGGYNNVGLGIEDLDGLDKEKDGKGKGKENEKQKGKESHGKTAKTLKVSFPEEDEKEKNLKTPKIQPPPSASTSTTKMARRNTQSKPSSQIRKDHSPSPVRSATSALSSIASQDSLTSTSTSNSGTNGNSLVSRFTSSFFASPPSNNTKGSLAPPPPTTPMAGSSARERLEATMAKSKKNNNSNNNNAPPSSPSLSSSSDVGTTPTEESSSLSPPSFSTSPADALIRRTSSASISTPPSPNLSANPSPNNVSARSSWASWTSTFSKAGPGKGKERESDSGSRPAFRFPGIGKGKGRDSAASIGSSNTGGDGEDEIQAPISAKDLLKQLQKRGEADAWEVLDEDEDGVEREAVENGGTGKNETRTGEEKKEPRHKTSRSLVLPIPITPSTATATTSLSAGGIGSVPFPPSSLSSTTSSTISSKVPPPPESPLASRSTSTSASDSTSSISQRQQSHRRRVTVSTSITPFGNSTPNPTPSRSRHTSSSGPGLQPSSFSAAPAVLGIPAKARSSLPPNLISTSVGKASMTKGLGGDGDREERKG